MFPNAPAQPLQGMVGSRGAHRSSTIPFALQTPGARELFSSLQQLQEDTLTPASVKGGSCSQLCGGLENLPAGLSQL